MNQFELETHILETAKEILESEKDWCQGSMYKPDYADLDQVEAACAVGALCLAMERTVRRDELPFGWYSATRTSCESRLRNHIPIEDHSVPAYNDRLDTTKEDVLLMFKRAIEEGNE